MDSTSIKFEPGTGAKEGIAVMLTEIDVELDHPFMKNEYSESITDKNSGEIRLLEHSNLDGVPVKAETGTKKTDESDITHSELAIDLPDIKKESLKHHGQIHKPMGKTSNPEAKRAKRAEYMRKYRNQQRGKQTTEEVHKSRALEAQRIRNFRQMQQQETEEEASQRRALHAQQIQDVQPTHTRAEYMRNYRNQQREKQTTEEVHMSRALEAQRIRNFRQIQQQQETEEEARQRRALHARQMRDIRKAQQLQQQPETEEEANQRRALHAQCMRSIRRRSRKLQAIHHDNFDMKKLEIHYVNPLIGN